MLLMSQKSEEQKLFHQSQVHGDADHLSGGDISADEIKSWSVWLLVGMGRVHPAQRQPHTLN
jgi:hypothetical protein